ncbi:MAG: M28 family peptidase [Candidatus Zixiibacteriota bacterium]|nr:MAG: M28 family peptidase [candidate division Zixibacteria bacterium]
MKKALMVCLLSMFLFSIASSSNDRIFIVSFDSADDLGVLSDYPGRYWGKSAGKVFLCGGIEEGDWLNDKGFRFEAVDFEGENYSIYLITIENTADLPGDVNVLYRGDGFVLSTYAPESNYQYRRLDLKKYPKNNYHNNSGDIILEYNSVIDHIIAQVSQDTIMQFLTGLSGETGVWVNGQLDTIATRYSPTDDNALAAAYLMETLINYGYQAEYHGFFGGAGRHIAMYDENLAWMVTEGARAYRTTNGGAAWIYMPVITYAELWGVTNIGADSVWVTANYGIIKFSSDGGQNFFNQNSNTNDYLFGVDFINGSEGWIAGDNGRILHTTNAGWAWSTQSTPTSSRLYDVCFVDNEYGWAVGRNGTVIHTTNGGADWTNQNANTGSRIYSVNFIDRNSGWLCGWDGVVRRTTNGGANWQTVYLGNSIEKYHVDFVNPSFGCIVGWDGEIFTTTDGGDNWTEQSSNTVKNFYGVSFADTSNGIACGSGIISRTTDGGITWIDESGNNEDAWQNVIATKTGTVYPDEQVVICGHFDNTSEQPYDTATGADDNGSGTTAVIEAARLFASGSFERTVKFCLWTGEEQGLLGSAAYAADAYIAGDNIVGVYNFDMIAYDGNNDGSIELHCGTMNPSIELGNLFQTVINDYSIALIPQQITYGSTDRSDHASFWDFNYPAILGIEDASDDFNPYYHTTGDNMSIINAPYFTEYSKAAIGVTATLATPDSTMTSIYGPVSLPSEFVLHGNYPNPFNAATTISFAIPSGSDVDLAVYDILGRKVARLFEGRLDAGDHRIAWNADGLSSGLYFYRLSVDGRENVGRMTLLK